eukprot:TRINITY_DN1516_c0_g1_i1.p2 TRINITY_DN1516_c0_g1~~TRINITY_DN1516_c0_g1_i1.p2  ORF type:complete len:206 (-),score=21.65 TRINITY_DN1516_c0_g1_i1:180-797(-)
MASSRLSLTVLLVLMVVAVAPQGHAQTATQFKAEVSKMYKTISANTKLAQKYSIFLKAVTSSLNGTWNSTTKFPTKSTLLIPNNAAATKLFSKVKMSKENAAKLTNIGNSHILTTRYTFAQLVLLPANTPIKTWQGMSAVRYRKNNLPLPVLIGQQGLRPVQVSVGAPAIVDKDMYSGPYFTVQGVNNVMQTRWYAPAEVPPSSP